MVKNISDEYVYKKKLIGRFSIMVLQFRLSIRWFLARWQEDILNEVNQKRLHCT